MRLLVSDFENLKSRGALNKGGAFNSYCLVVVALFQIEEKSAIIFSCALFVFL